MPKLLDENRVPKATACYHPSIQFPGMSDIASSCCSACLFQHQPTPAENLAVWLIMDQHCRKLVFPCGHVAISKQVFTYFPKVHLRHCQQHQPFAQMRLQVFFSIATVPDWSTRPAVSDKNRTLSRYFPPLGKMYGKTSSILNIQSL